MSDTGSQEKDPLTGTEQPFVQHLKELRDRLVKPFIAVAVMCAVLSVYPGPGQLYDLLAEMRETMIMPNADRDHNDWQRCRHCGLRSDCAQRLG